MARIPPKRTYYGLMNRAMLRGSPAGSSKGKGVSWQPWLITSCRCGCCENASRSIGLASIALRPPQIAAPKIPRKQFEDLSSLVLFIWWPFVFAARAIKLENTRKISRNILSIDIDICCGMPWSPFDLPSTSRIFFSCCC